MLATSGGIDPYSTAASDTYMDLFGIGSFTGKGIYDVDAFEAATGDTFPENRILSHDLIEGNYAAAGCSATPSCSTTSRRATTPMPAASTAGSAATGSSCRGWRPERLVGMWRKPPIQPFGPPSPRLARQADAIRLPILERWKLLDNLRRSLVPPALLVLLVLGWTVLPGSPWFWTATVLAVLLLPLFQMVSSVAIGCTRCRSLAPLEEGLGAIPAVFGQVGWRSSSWPIEPGCCSTRSCARWCGCS